MIFRFWCLLLVVFAGCSSNTCQELCDAFYQMQLRCDLFAYQDDQHPTLCVSSADNAQALKQEVDYATRQCRQDFLNPSCEEQRNCCKSECFRNLLRSYDSVTGVQERDYEMQRDLCQKYRQLVKLGDAAWCDALQVDCIQEQEKAFPDCDDDQSGPVSP